MFNQNSLVENALGLAPEGSGDSHLLPFAQLESPAHWWGFMRSTFVPGILSPDFDPGHDNRALELITGPRIRQVRVRSAAWWPRTWQNTARGTSLCSAAPRCRRGAPGQS